MVEERTRSRSDISIGNAWTLRSHNMYLSGTETSVTTYTGVDDPQSVIEVITDTHCVPDESTEAQKLCSKKARRHSFNPVSHVKTTFYPAPPLKVDVDFLYNNNLNRKWWEGTLYGGSNEMDIFLNRVNFSNGDISAIELSNAIRELKPSVEKFLPNTNVYEILGDLKKMRGLLHAFTVDHRDSLAQTFAKKHLEYNFGFKPLLNDLMAIYTIQETVDAIINRWNSFARAGKVMDFHGTIKSGEVAEDWEVINYDYPETSDIRAFGRKYKMSFNHRSLVHVYIKPFVIPESKKMSVILKALGVDKPLAGLWELIPFSWAVDYFVNVGEMISQFEKGLDDMFQFEVVSAGYSRRLTLTGYSKHYREFGTNRATLPTEWSEHIHSEYVRVPLPITLFDSHIVPRELGWTDGPNVRQGGYMLAVGILGLKR